MSTKMIIQITGRRWFQKSYGNTYHVTDVLVMDLEKEQEQRVVSPETYGYGEQYIQTASDLIKKQLPDVAALLGADIYNLVGFGARESLKKRGIVVRCTAIDVQRKKDL